MGRGEYITFTLAFNPCRQTRMPWSLLTIAEPPIISNHLMSEHIVVLVLVRVEEHADEVSGREFEALTLDQSHPTPESTHKYD